MGSADWTPIYKSDDADDEAGYQGTFDGKGYMVAYRITSAADYDVKGLFGVIGASGDVKNLTVSADIKLGSSDAQLFGASIGAIAGKNIGKVSACTNTGTITIVGYGNKTGGLIGDDRGRIVNCANKGATSSYDPVYHNSFAHTGGIAGMALGTVLNCINSSSVSTESASSNQQYAGGTWNAMIINCTNTGSVAASGTSPCAGGIAGRNEESSTIANCTNTGSVKASNTSPNAGGIAGWNSMNSTIANCISRGSAEGSGSNGNLGGIVGHNSSSVISNASYVKSGDLPTIGKSSNASADKVISLDAASFEDVAVTYIISDDYTPSERKDALHITAAPYLSKDVVASENYAKFISNNVTISCDKELLSWSYNGDGKFTVTAKKEISQDLPIEIQNLGYTDFGTGAFNVITSTDFTVKTYVPAGSLTPSTPRTPSGSSGGCSAGFAALALLGMIPVVLKKKK